MLRMFVNSIVAMVKLFGEKPSVLKVLTTIMTYLPSLVQQVIDFKKADAGERFDEFLETLDAYTGTDEGAVRVFPHLPPEREEEFWDAIKAAVRIHGNQLLKREGYYVA